MKIYAYGIIDFHNRLEEPIAGLDPSLGPSFKGIGRPILSGLKDGKVYPLGLEGAGVYNVSYRDIGVAVSELNEETKEMTDTCILEHEKVVERLMIKFTVLPMRFLTVFNTKEDILSMVEFYYEDFKNNLERLCNKVEFGIKVIWPANTIRQRIIDAYHKINPTGIVLPKPFKEGTKHNPEGIGLPNPLKEGPNISVSTESPAKTFVKEKFEKHIIEKEFEEEANKCIAVVDDYFNKIAVEKKLKRLQTESLLLNASYLVDKDRQNEFKQAFEQLKNTPGGLKFLFSGPWPCYNFVTLTKKPSSVDYFMVYQESISPFL